MAHSLGGKLLEMFDIIKRIPIAAETLDALRESAAARGGQVEKIPRRKEAKAVQVITPQKPVEVWVEPEPYSGYAGAWEAVFYPVDQYVQIWNRATSDPFDERVAVDHVLSRAIASALNYDYVRIFPVAHSVNSHFGRSFEKPVKANTSPGKTSARREFRNGMEHMDILGLGKILNTPLEHAMFKRTRPPPEGHLRQVQNRGFLEQYLLNHHRTLQVLRDIGFLWWNL